MYGWTELAFLFSLRSKMDINSLLSPQDSPASEAPPNISSPHLSSGRHSGRPSVTERKSSGLSQQITPDQITSAPSPTAQYFPRTTQQQPLRSPHAASHFSPHAQALAAAQIHAATAYAAQHPDVARAGVLSFPRTSPGDATTPGSESRSPLEARSPMVQLAQPPLSRNTSTPQMDTLAGM